MADKKVGSTAEETSALNRTLKEFVSSYQADQTANERRNGTRFRIEVFLAIGVAINIALTIGLLIAGVFQTKHAGDQAKTGQEQLAVARDTETRQLKAYVGVVQQGLENFGTPQQALKITRKNFGLTPAVDLFMAPPAIAVLNRGQQFGPVHCTPAPAVVNTFTLFPQQESNFTIKGFAGVSQEQVDLVKKGGDYVLVYWGALHYKDVFGAQRCTRYCWSFSGANMDAANAELCFQHNDSY
ncbi:hypothetical protein JQ628_07645 [Bradyrhizobium lablabi]|uniref:hypothetical protein n=1 Tax=Bradyrhizobium lablabi TaxID=722472 RepID=UPI001BABB098|nr:hypothetical protein [Bradyrhizobium lablabi]MBR1121385.1 hypothetical protein [Bradyrhizobium lablabi]